VTSGADCWDHMQEICLYQALYIMNVEED